MPGLGRAAGTLTRPESSSRNARAAGAGSDGKGKGSKSLFLASLLPITPCAPLARESERPLGTDESGRDPWLIPAHVEQQFCYPNLGSDPQPIQNSTTSSPGRFSLALGAGQGKAPWGRGWKLHFLIKLINFPWMTPSPLRRRESWIPWFVWNLSDHIHCVNFKYICTTTELTIPNKTHNFIRSWVSPGYRKCTPLPSNGDKLVSP